MRFFSGWIGFVGPAIHVSLTPSFRYQKVEKGRAEREEDMKPDEDFGPPLTTSASRLCGKVLSFGPVLKSNTGMVWWMRSGLTVPPEIMDTLCDLREETA